MGIYTRSSVLSVGSAVLVLAGAMVCALPALWLGINLGYYPSRMVCTPETGYGSGCYEGGMEIAFVVFSFVWLPCAGVSLYATLRFRLVGTWIRRWWPFLAFSVLTVLFVAAGIFSALSDPYAHF